MNFDSYGKTIYHESYLSEKYINGGNTQDVDNKHTQNDDFAHLMKPVIKSANHLAI